MWSKNIKKLRKQMGFSQYKIAEKLGIKRGTYGSYEEYRAEPNISTLIKMSEIYRVSLDDLILKQL